MVFLHLLSGVISFLKLASSLPVGFMASLSWAVGAASVLCVQIGFLKGHDL